MILKQIGIVLGVLLILVIVGNIWFYFVDGFIEKIKHMFHGGPHEENWHTLHEDDSDIKD